MYKPLFCQKCGQMMLDDKDVAALVLRVDTCQGISKSIIDCPHCCFRWGLVVVSDPSGWLTCLMPPEALNVVYQSFQEARNLGAQVNLMSAILDKLIARHLEAKR